MPCFTGFATLLFLVLLAPATLGEVAEGHGVVDTAVTDKAEGVDTRTLRCKSLSTMWLFSYFVILTMLATSSASHALPHCQTRAAVVVTVGMDADTITILILLEK